jgi:hypothetical protein
LIARAMLVSATGFVALLGAGPAAALSPWEASEISRDIGRPLPSYIRIDPPDTTVDDGPPRMLFAPGGAPLPVYLNRHGGTYRCGNDDSARNLSSVVCERGGGGVGTIGSFSGSDVQWNGIKSCVADLFSRFNVFVTDLEPTSGAYVEAVVGGRPGEANMPNGVGGVAPFSCGMLPRAVVYAFSDIYGNRPRDVCETVAQEVAHAFGLDHEFLCSDPMTYLRGCGAKSFQDEYAQCGEFEPRECSCGGASQNSVQLMMQRLGPSDGSPPPPPPVDREDPTVALTAPAAAAVLPAGSTITVSAQATDDIGLSLVELEWDFTGDSMFCPATFNQTGSYECIRSGSNYTWNIQVGSGSRTFRVRVRDVAGNEALSDDRTIWLSEDGSGPPDDLGPPNVFVGSPAHRAVLPANAVVEIVATIADDSGIARAELMWTNGDAQTAFPCPADNQVVSCGINGTTYTWRLRVGEGARSFSVRARDVVGNVTESDLRRIQLTPGAALVADEDDDTLDRATRITCGETRSGVASDADWFDVDAPEGKIVTVTLDGEALGNVDLLATTGPLADDVIGEGSGGLRFDGQEGGVKVAVVPARADAGSYSIEIYCEDPPPPPVAAKTCATAGLPASWLGLLALLGLSRRRRA